MFKTRLNPTKPSAGHRAVLERVGAACRELRPIEDACCAEGRRNERAPEILARHGALAIGIDAEFGGAGTDPLLVVMAAERIGREGSHLVNVFAELVSVAAVVRRSGEADQKARLLPAVARGEVVLDRDCGISFDHSAAVAELREMLGDPERISEFEFTLRLNARLALSAGSIGVLADCLETSAEFAAKRIKGEDATNTPKAVKLHFAQTASDLEATRALVYSAAALKAEFDRHPESDHLRLEAGTLVDEGNFFSAGAVNRMFVRMTRVELGGEPLRMCLPPRHQITPRDALLFDESVDPIAEKIARFYLFQ